MEFRSEELCLYVANDRPRAREKKLLLLKGINASEA